MKLFAWNHQGTFGFGQYRLQNQKPKLLLLGVLPWGWSQQVFGQEIFKAVKSAKYEQPVLISGELKLTVDSQAERAKHRPPNYASLDEETQWEIDKALGILDWEPQE